LDDYNNCTNTACNCYIAYQSCLRACVTNPYCASDLTAIVQTCENNYPNIKSTNNCNATVATVCGTVPSPPSSTNVRCPYKTYCSVTTGNCETVGNQGDTCDPEYNGMDCYQSRGCPPLSCVDEGQGNFQCDVTPGSYGLGEYCNNNNNYCQANDSINYPQCTGAAVTQCTGIPAGQDCTNCVEYCDVGLYCTSTTKVCAPIQGDGQTCAGDYMCLPGSQCVSGYCRQFGTVSTGSTCNIDDNCHYNNYCDSISEVCTVRPSPIACTSNSQCVGSVCDCNSGYCANSIAKANCDNQLSSLISCMRQNGCEDANLWPGSCALVNCPSTLCAHLKCIDKNLPATPPCGSETYPSKPAVCTQSTYSSASILSILYLLYFFVLLI